jgi:hypothetical protein
VREQRAEREREREGKGGKAALALKWSSKHESFLIVAIFFVYLTDWGAN